MNNNFKTENIIWLDKGIKLTIIYILYSQYKYIKYKNIIIDNKNFRNFAKSMFPELSILKNNKKIIDPFYFNIRYIIKKQDIIIDHIKNYDKSILTKKISLVPWYDMNDPLIVYKYNKKYNIDVDKYKNFINNFSKFRRENYSNNILWDKYTENTILNLYNKKYNTDIVTKFNNHIIKDYTIINDGVEKLINYDYLYKNNNSKRDIHIKNKLSTLITNHANKINKNDLDNKKNISMLEENYRDKINKNYLDNKKNIDILEETYRDKINKNNLDNIDNIDKLKNQYDQQTDYIINTFTQTFKLMNDSIII